MALKKNPQHSQGHIQKSHSLLSDKRLKGPSPHLFTSGTRQGHWLLSLLLNIVLEVLVRVIMKKKNEHPNKKK